MIRKQLICYLLMTLLVVPIAWSKERAIRPADQQSNADIRQALVIGNSAYTSAGMLRNPVNDARAISNTLSQLGFEVTTITNADQRKMEQSIRDFGKELRNQKGVGLFYYAGHGMQFDGENYLLPTDIDPSTEEDVRYDAVPVGKLLAQMRAADNKMNVVILDACRNNPFSRSFRTFNPGLAQVNAAAGTFISFATAPGQIAADGEGSNGLFTSKLLQHLRTPGLKIEEVFKRTTADVYTASNERQAPWVQYSVIGDFYFAPGTLEAQPKKFPTQRPKLAKGVGLSGEATRKTLLATKKCVGCDLTRATLRKANLAGANLIGAILRKATLTGSDLAKASLREADLTQTYLTAVDLSGADLSGADLTGAYMIRANLIEANLRGAILNTATFAGAHLSGADLSGADLTGAYLSAANLRGAKFCKTKMPDGSINNQNCDQPVQDEKPKSDPKVDPEVIAAKKLLLETRKCVRCGLRGVNLSAVDLSKTDLDTANLSLADLSRTNLTGAYLVRVNLIRTNLVQANLTNANLTRANLKGAMLFGATLTGTKFCKTKMPDGSINNSDC